MENYRGGSLGRYLEKWKEYTSDKNILTVIKSGLCLNFVDSPPTQGPFEYPRGKVEFNIINGEIQKLLSKGVIEYSHREEGEYFSNLFTAPKKDGTHRTILNLKYLNKECDKAHFKMESLKQALHMVRQGAFLASIDIKDAFYSVPIHGSHKKYLKFMWTGEILQFRAMPNGYCDAMRVFTKLLKPVFAKLRERGFESVIYVDDSLLQGDDFKECAENIRITLRCLQELGFVIHPRKSILYPTQIITFLGFIINTLNMTVRLTPEKKAKIIAKGLGLLNKKGITIRAVSSFIGNITASFEAVPYGRLHYRHIEDCKTAALSAHKYDFEAPCTLDENAINEITWWIENIDHSFAEINKIPDIDRIIYTDASKHLGGGWGASDGAHEDINGRWDLSEQDSSINYLELKAIHLAIKSYAPLYKNCKHIKIMTDNTSAIAYINKQGGTHSMALNDLAVELWETCISLNIHISAAHIPGKHNVLADSASRKFQDAAEWMLCPRVFTRISIIFGKPEVDMFASRLNYQLPCYASWHPDPESTYIDAMQICWAGKYIYAFPPFSMVWPLLTKIRQDRVERALVVVPRWPTQSWYPTLKKMKVKGTTIITVQSSTLSLPGTRKKHPLSPKLKLLVMVLSGCRRQHPC